MVFKFIKYFSTNCLQSSYVSLEVDEDDGLELGLLRDELGEADGLETEDEGLELAGLLGDELGALLEEELLFNNFVDTSLAKLSPDEVVFLPPAAEVALPLLVIITSSTLE